MLFRSPFCLLKREYGHVGFALYLPLFLGCGSGLAAGVLAALPQSASSAATIAAARRALGRFSSLAFVVVAGVAAAIVAASHLVLVG